MILNKKIAIVVPAYNVGEEIVKFLDNIPDYVDKIFLIDDCCPLQTGKLAKKNSNDHRLNIIFNNQNLGVGGAVKVGYLKCIEDSIDIVVKIDGDNQMDPLEINAIVNPLITQNFDYSKGNRFLNNDKIENYPIVRFYGNIFLSFMSKLSSGYWDIFDPINGFTAIKINILKKLNLKIIDDGYYFESDMLFNLYNLKIKIKDVPVKIKYHKHQKQNLNVFKESFNFFNKNISRIIKRIKTNYFRNNFGLGSFFIFIFLLSFTFTLLYGGINYLYYFSIKAFAPTGVILISSVSCLLMFLSLMIFLIIDNLNNPNK